MKTRTVTDRMRLVEKPGGWVWAGFASSRSAWTTVLMRSLHPEKA